METAAVNKARPHGDAGSAAVQAARSHDEISAALAMLERALELDDKTGFAAPFATNAGLALKKLRRIAEARERLQLAVQLDPELFYPRYALGNLESEVLYTCALACEAHWLEAEEQLSASVRLAPSPDLKAAAATNLAELLRRAHHELFGKSAGSRIPLGRTNPAKSLSGRDLLREARALLDDVVEASKAQHERGLRPSLPRPTVTTLSALLQQSGRESQARELHAWAVKLGLWNDVRQRPEHFNPRLRSRGPWWDTHSRFSLLGRLGAHWRALREEALSLASRHLKLVGGRQPVDRLLYDPLRGERWGEFAVVHERRAVEGASDLAPLLWDLVRGHLSQVQQAVYSVLQPGTKISPHCGPSNELLTCHLGLRVPSARPDELGIRVGGEERMWPEGDWLCFEDSFEHEVWNLSDEPRAVLLVNFFNPDLSSL